MMTATYVARHGVTRFAETNTISNIEIFASGTYRGKDYSVQDLDTIARNFARLGEQGKNLLRVPVVYGHEEDRTDKPAAGWVSGVRVKKYRDPDTGKLEGTLLADFSDVPQETRQLVRSKRFRHVSAEVYDNFLDDYERGFGMALRRVALLGNEVPQCKRIAELPRDQFSDRLFNPFRLRRVGISRNESLGTFTIFSEVTQMERESLVKQLLALVPDLDPRTQESLTDEQIMDIVAALGGETTDPLEAAPVEGAAGMMGEVKKMRRFADRTKLDSKAKENVVRVFSERRKRNPALTAAQHARELGLRV